MTTTEQTTSADTFAALRCVFRSWLASSRLDTTTPEVAERFITLAKLAADDVLDGC